ncbi:phage tail protein [Azoarcus indigens]|uniref:Phage tail sheath gpL-like n=1 Tax=Azoarcus indigens TaxID=29545 RepID=A0A4V3BMK1_9RHOO|nr:phage tail sheath subtilisin-like domain-containing protein [Azoarcus indigens]NMG64884.1 phage tail protein [Azoarcus indigens]TDN50422.1 phage tail sheath gpL-like [Azoarcus indigens]
MSISFNDIPSNARVPLFYAEVDNSMANSGGTTLRRLIIGQVNDGQVPEELGKLTLVSSQSLANAIGGQGSMLAAMYAAHRLSDPFGEVWCLPLPKGVGAAAAGTVTITGPATASGLLSLYIAGTRVQAAVVAADVAATVATALAAAINANPDLPVTASAAAGVVTVTAKFAGVLGNDIRMVLNFLGRDAGESIPAGLGIVITAMAGGAGAPDMAAATAALGDEEFEFITLPWSDTATLDVWQVVMGDSSGRWSWIKQLYGHVYSAKRGTLGALVAAGQLRNDQHVTVVGMETTAPSPVWVEAAAYAARTAVFISADPARPTQTGELTGLRPAPASDRFTKMERQSLLGYGIATRTYEGGALRTERAVTTYQKNAYGQPDDSYLDSETMHQTAHIVRYLRSRITSKYGRHKLANDGTRFGAGQAIVTPSVIRAELIAAYYELEQAGIVENADLFAKNLIVERNASNPNRLDVLFPPDYVNQLRVFALLNQFRLQYPAAA